MSFRHLIITRFNLQYEAGCNIGCQQEWLERRCSLFETYCMPSIQHQTCRHFAWLLLCDAATPEPYRSRIEAYKTAMPEIEVLWEPFFDDLNRLYSDIGKQYSEGVDFLLTTRLDNDDALAPSYVEEVQHVADKGEEGVITFPQGRQTFVNDGRSYRVRYRSNHFTSRLETRGFATVLGFDHTCLDGVNLIVVETDGPMWEEFVHDSNMLNDYMPQYQYKVESLSDVFDLSHRWMRFQRLRLFRLLKSLFVASH